MTRRRLVAPSRPFTQKSLLMAAVAFHLVLMVVVVEGFVVPTTTLLGRTTTATVVGRSGPPVVASRTTALDTKGYNAAVYRHLNLGMDPVAIADASSSVLPSSNLLLSFTDQGQNLAGIFFQASLIPYLLFLYFLGFRGNRIPALANFGFQFVLLFVLSTIPSGIVSKSVYGDSLANVDWLHGGAELLLTMANIFIVLGLKEAMTTENPSPSTFPRGRTIGFGAAAAFFLALAAGPSLGVEVHSPFLFGLGGLPDDTVLSLPWVTHTEPANALSVPTWAIHWSSVFEYLFAMNLVWNFADVTGNDKWKGLTWGMLPLHASGICACTYHFFYNPSVLQFLVSMQAGLTLLGNLTCMWAAYRIAAAAGWTVEGEANPFPKSATSPTGLIADGWAATPLQVKPESVRASTGTLALQLAGLTLGTSYLIKYGELGLDLPFQPDPAVALFLVLSIPAITAYQYYNMSRKDAEESGDTIFSLPGFFGGNTDSDKSTLSMDDVKKFGVAGTVAYVLTEVAFWAVAFPVASYALYESTGHWPDVVSNTADRAEVIAFIFAGANIARAFVPVRLGAALALAPWVERNLLQQQQQGGSNNDSAAGEGRGLIDGEEQGADSRVGM